MNTFSLSIFCIIYFRSFPFTSFNRLLFLLVSFCTLKNCLAYLNADVPSSKIRTRSWHDIYLLDRFNLIIFVQFVSGKRHFLSHLLLGDAKEASDGREFVLRKRYRIFPFIATYKTDFYFTLGLSLPTPPHSPQIWQSGPTPSFLLFLLRRQNEPF